MMCTVEGCNSQTRHLRGLCVKHYRRWKKWGDPLLGGRGYNSKGKRKHFMYGAWAAMINRCYNPNNSSYARYGARGITVCQRWRDDFFNFLEDMGERPAGKTLDRIDPLKNYEPGNCRWATVQEQRANLSAAGDARMRKAVSKSVSAYWREWRKHNELKPKHIPAGPRTRTCRHCGTTFTQPPVGQPRKYCSDACRSQFYAANGSIELRSTVLIEPEMLENMVGATGIEPVTPAV